MARSKEQYNRNKVEELRYASQYLVNGKPDARQIARLAENQNVLRRGKSQTRSSTVLNDLK